VIVEQNNEPGMHGAKPDRGRRSCARGLKGRDINAGKLGGKKKEVAGLWSTTTRAGIFERIKKA